MLVTYGLQLTICLAKLNLELNLPFLWMITTPTLTRLQMSGLRRRQYHHHSTLQETQLDWTPSTPWAMKMLSWRSELRPAQCALNPLLTWRKPFSSWPTSQLFSTFRLLTDIEACYCYALLKKAGLEDSSPWSYLVSNLSFLWKVLEMIVNRKLIRYLKDFHLFPNAQSAYHCCIESIFRYYWCDHQWQDFAYIIASLNGSFQHRRPRHFAAATRDNIRLQQLNNTVAIIVCRRFECSQCIWMAAFRIHVMLFVKCLKGLYLGICYSLSKRQTSASSFSHLVWIITPAPMMVFKALHGLTPGYISLLHLKAAFNIVDHDILLQRLETIYGFNSSIPQWLWLFVEDLNAVCTF